MTAFPLYTDCAVLAWDSREREFYPFNFIPPFGSFWVTGSFQMAMSDAFFATYHYRTYYPSILTDLSEAISTVLRIHQVSVSPGLISLNMQYADVPRCERWHAGQGNLTLGVEIEDTYYDDYEFYVQVRDSE
jgi:hypothetical protein